MTNTNPRALILPELPVNLECLHKEEERIRTESILYINSQEDLAEHIKLVYTSLNLLYDVTHDYRNQTDNELTIQYLGLRMFNAIVASLKVGLSGYYQILFSQARDIVEVGFLLDYFSNAVDKISHWKNCENKERYKYYKPSIIRETLDKRDRFTKSKRTEIYQHLCEYAAHASYPGNKLVAPKGLGEIGPFYEEKYLRASVVELAMRVPWAVLVYVGHFKNLPHTFFKSKIDFLDQYKNWGKKYYNLDMSHIDTESPKELLKYL